CEQPFVSYEYDLDPMSPGYGELLAARDVHGHGPRYEYFHGIPDNGKLNTDALEARCNAWCSERFKGNGNVADCQNQGLCGKWYCESEAFQLCGPIADGSPPPCDVEVERVQCLARVKNLYGLNGCPTSDAQQCRQGCLAASQQVNANGEPAYSFGTPKQ